MNIHKAGEKTCILNKSFLIETRKSNKNLQFALKNYFVDWHKILDFLWLVALFILVYELFTSIYMQQYVHMMNKNVTQ
jgi:hypothetical protein